MARPAPMKHQKFDAAGATRQWQSIEVMNQRMVQRLKQVQTLLSLDGRELARALRSAQNKRVFAGLMRLDFFHTLPGWPLGDWIAANFPESVARQVLHTARAVSDAAITLEAAGDWDEPYVSHRGVPSHPWIRNVTTYLEKHTKIVNGLLAQMAPTTFTHQGVSILNPQRMPDRVVKGLLDGLDYAFALFKRRGVQGVLDASLKYIMMRNRMPSEKAQGTLGWYHGNKRAITLLGDAITARNPRMLKTWVHEVLVHELGHHVHMSLLDYAARKEWDSGWAPVLDAESAAEQTDLDLHAVKHEDRKRFWGLLVKSKGALKAVRLKALDRMKFHAWLREPMMGEGFVTPKQLRWTQRGQGLRSLLSNPVQYMLDERGISQGDQDYERVLGRVFRQRMSTLGVTDSYAPYTHPTLTDEQVEQYKVDDPGVAKALQELGTPTDYAQTNEKEDFAETWVAYMGAPGRLTPNAKFRMQKALSMSGLMGRPIMDRVGRVAARWLARSAATTPLPDHFDKEEPGLLTEAEFLKVRNPKDEWHEADSYDWDLQQMNQDRTLQHLGEFGPYGEIIRVWGTKHGLLLKDSKGQVIGVVHRGTLYHDKWADSKIRDGIRDGYWDNHDKRNSFGVKRRKIVKYVTEAAALVSSVARNNLAAYPVVLQNIRLKGEPFQVRAERALEKGGRTTIGATIAILNSGGLKVASAQDEWGATLLVVAQEYRGRGLGQVIGKLWYKYNPSAPSGGFTSAGEANAIALWKARVREFLNNGWYSELVREDRLTTVRVKAILADLGEREPRRAPETAKPQKKVLVMVDYPSFVIYDQAFFGDQDDKYIYGYGFFRGSNGKSFLFTIDYEQEFAKLATSVALQMARDEGEPVYVGKGYGDTVEWELLPEAKREGDYVSLTRDVLNLSQLGGLEKQIRRKLDSFDQSYNLLLEMSESKWG